MLTLHATYDNGQIIFKEKDLPKIKAEAEIMIDDAKSEVVYEGKHKFYKINGKVNSTFSRDEIYDDRA